MLCVVVKIVAVVWDISDWSQCAKIPKNGSIVLASTAIRAPREKISNEPRKDERRLRSNPQMSNIPNHQGVIMRTPVETENALRVPLKCGKRHRGRSSEIPKLYDWVSIVCGGSHKMQTLSRIPLNVTNGLWRSQLAPWFELL